MQAPLSPRNSSKPTRRRKTRAPTTRKKTAERNVALGSLSIGSGRQRQATMRKMRTTKNLRTTSRPGGTSTSRGRTGVTVEEAAAGPRVAGGHGHGSADRTGPPGTIIFWKIKRLLAFGGGTVRSRFEGVKGCQGRCPHARFKDTS